MFKTKTLGSLKSIFPPIHQPLPLSQRESQKLLNVLTSSFRARLDEEHGKLNHKDVADLPPSPAVKYLPSTAENTPSQPTDRHLRAVLNNPLFKDATLKDPSSSGRDSKEIFQRAVAKGLMTIPRAHGFLLRVLQDLRKSTAISLEDEMRQYGAGLLVIRWLRASGEERRLSFIKEHPNFTTDLLRFMVAEEFEDLIWTWFRQLCEPALVDKEAVRVFIRSLVSVKCESSELDGAYATVLELQKRLRAVSNPALKRILQPAWFFVAGKTTSDSWRNQISSVELFESFCALGTKMGARASLYKAHLDLYHPERPSADAALRELYRPQLWLEDLPPRTQKWAQSGFHGGVPPFVELVNSLGLDTVQHLIKTGQNKTAEQLLEYIRVQLEAQERYLPIGLSVLSKQGLANADHQYSVDGMPWSIV